MYNNVSNFRELNKRYSIFTTQHLLNKRHGHSNNRLENLTYEHLATIVILASKKGLLELEGKVKIIVGKDEEYIAILVAKERYRITIVSVIASKQSVFRKENFFSNERKMVLLDNVDIYAETEYMLKNHPKVFTGIYKTSEDFLTYVEDRDDSMLHIKIPVFNFVPKTKDGKVLIPEVVPDEVLSFAIKEAYKISKKDILFKNIVVDYNDKLLLIHALFPDENTRPTEKKIKILRYFFIPKIEKTLDGKKAQLIKLKYS